MKKAKLEKGITLIALIITIVVLLILAVVTIGAIQESKIITHAQNASDSYTIAQEKERIGLALSEWNIEDAIPGNNPVFKNVITNELQGQNVSITGEDNGPLTVTFNKTENSYTVTKEGEITPITKGITLSSTSLSIAPGKTAQLTATLTGITGNVTWTSADTNVVTVTTSEDTLTATLTVADGATLGTTVEITATCGEYSAKCTITVEEASNIDELEKYILGEDEEGRDLFGILDAEKFIFQQDPLDSESTVHEKVKLAYMKENEEYTFYIRYNRDVYKFDYSVNIINGDDDDEDNDEYECKTVKDSLTLVNTPTGNLGKYVTYANNTWIVLKDDANGVELISANGLGELKFEQSDFNAGRTNYNKAVETIVNKCKAETGLTSNIRSVGGPATEESLSDTNTVDFSTLETFTPSVDDSQFSQYEGATNGLRKGDTNYEVDYALMESLGILATDTPADYWLASRFVGEGFYSVSFRVRYVNCSSSLDGHLLCYVDDYADTYPYSRADARAVRPVVSLESGILDGKTETGLRDNPIVLD